MTNVKAVDSGYYLVVNLGLRSIRAILYDAEGSIHAKNWYPIQTLIHTGRVEQNPDEWWSLCSRLLDEILTGGKDYAGKLRAVTVTASANCLVVLDKNGRPVCNSFMVSDKRAAKEAAEMSRDGELKSLFENPNFLANASYVFPKIAWLKRHQPHLYARARFFMGANDYLVHKLTGRVVTDVLNAEKMYYDRKKKSYPLPLLQKLKISAGQLPDVVEVGGAALKPLRNIVKKYKMSPQTRIIVTTYDAICAFIGSGALTEGESCNVCGTVSSFRVYTKKNVKPNSGVLNQDFGAFSIIGGSNNIDGGLLEWSKHVFYGDSYPERYIYKIMEDEARQSPAGSRGLLFLPYLVGERFPFFDSYVRGMFFGLERFHRRNDVIRSILESSSYMIHDSIQAIEKYGIKVSAIRMSGGMVRNNLLCQIRSDVTGKVVRLVDEIEITSLGALFIMFKATGRAKDFRELADLIHIKQTFYPETANYKHYQAVYAFFKKLYYSTKDLMQERHTLLSKSAQKEKFVLENL